MEGKMRSSATEILRREHLSLLRYVCQTSPFVTAEDRPLLSRLRDFVASEGRILEAFAEVIDRQRMTLPNLGAFPTSFTNYNFVSIRKLLGPLVEDHGRHLELLEHDLGVLSSGPARDALDHLAALKRMHLTEMEKMVG